MNFKCYKMSGRHLSDMSITSKNNQTKHTNSSGLCTSISFIHFFHFIKKFRENGLQKLLEALFSVIHYKGSVFVTLDINPRFCHPHKTVVSGSFLSFAMIPFSVNFEWPTHEMLILESERPKTYAIIPKLLHWHYCQE